MRHDFHKFSDSPDYFCVVDLAESFGKDISLSKWKGSYSLMRGDREIAVTRDPKALDAAMRLLCPEWRLALIRAVLSGEMK